MKIFNLEPFFLTLLVSIEETLMTSNGNDVNSPSINSLNTNNNHQEINSLQSINSLQPMNTQFHAQNLLPTSSSNSHNINTQQNPTSKVSTAVNSSLANMDSKQFNIPNQPGGRVVGQKSSHSQAVSGYDTNSSNAGSENSPPHNKIYKYGNMPGNGVNVPNFQNQHQNQQK